MSLDVNKLEKVVELAAGAKRARCPACAEDGHDRKGEHLRIYPDGKFGCCVHAGDRDHRKRIFALAGSRERLAIRVKAAALPVAKIIQGDVVGRLGRVFGGLTRPAAHITTEVGTLGTPQYSHACEEKNLLKGEVCNRELIESRTPVPCVPENPAPLESETPVPSVPRSGQTAAVPVELETGVPSVPAVVGPPMVAGERLPVLTADGTLSIPFDAPERYHWWRGGQSVAETLAEVRAGLATKERMKHAVTV